MHCVASKGQTVDQIFTMENTHTIILDLMGLNSQKVFAKCSHLELTVVSGGHLGGVGQHCCCGSDSTGNYFHLALSIKAQDMIKYKSGGRLVFFKANKPR